MGPDGMGSSIAASRQPSANPDLVSAFIVLSSDTRVADPSAAVFAQMATVRSSLGVPADFVAVDFVLTKVSQPAANSFSYSFLAKFVRSGSAASFPYLGQPGAAGPPGPRGQPGGPGVGGPPGPTGPYGPIGANGPTGSMGAQGITGTTGPAGPLGAPGPAGPPGPTGPFGFTGPQGSPGPTGPAGPTGHTGAPGPPGTTGPLGPTGLQGSPGVTGATGPQGATGLAGPTGVVGPQASSDNAAALRMGPQRGILSDNQVSLSYLIRDTGLTDGTAYAGADLVVSERRILYTGTSGGTQAQLYSTELGGCQTGLDFSLPALFATAKNPTALVGVGIPGNFFNTLAVTSAGAVSNYIYESIHSSPADSNIAWPAGAEDWTGSRACFVFTRAYSQTFGAFAEYFFTAPLADKLYYGNAYWDTGDPTALTFPGETPTAVCATGDNTVWVSFTGSGKLRQFQLSAPGPTYPTVSQVGADVPLANIVELLFDGKYLWALSTGGANGTLYKLDGGGSLLDTFAFSLGSVTSRSRMCFDGSRLWITRDTRVSTVFPEGKIELINDVAVPAGQARGVAVDPQDGAVYIAVYAASLKIYAWYPPTGARQEVRTRSIVWRTGQFSMPSTFMAIDLPSDGLSGSTRQFEVDVNAVVVGAESASWKKYVTVYDSGTSLSLIGSVADVVPPMMNASAIASGFDVTVAVSTNLQFTITNGVHVGGVRWTMAVREVKSYGGAL